MVYPSATVTVATPATSVSVTLVPTKLTVSELTVATPSSWNASVAPPALGDAHVPSARR